MVLRLMIESYGSFPKEGSVLLHRGAYIVKGRVGGRTKPGPVDDRRGFDTIATGRVREEIVPGFQGSRQIQVANCRQCTRKKILGQDYTFFQDGDGERVHFSRK